ncbi:MAG: hypothetical protein ABIG63_00045, partial [Chloroflexota bacterium]
PDFTAIITELIDTYTTIIVPHNELRKLPGGLAQNAAKTITKLGNSRRVLSERSEIRLIGGWSATFAFHHYFIAFHVCLTLSQKRYY